MGPSPSIDDGVPRVILDLTARPVPPLMRGVGIGASSPPPEVFIEHVQIDGRNVRQYYPGECPSREQGKIG